MVQRTRRAALEPLPGNDSKAASEGAARRRLMAPATRDSARRRGSGSAKRRSDEHSSRSDSTREGPSPPASPAAASPRKSVLQTVAGFLFSPMAHVRSHSQYAGTKRKRGGGAASSGLSRASAKASGSATPSREERQARTRALDDGRSHGPSHTLRRGMSSLALDEAPPPRVAPTRRTSRSAEAAAPEKRRASFSRQASGSRARQPVSSQEPSEDEDDDDTADEGDREEGSAQHLSADEETALRCSASHAKLMRQRISLLQRLHATSVGEPDAMMTKQQLADAIIAARSPPRLTRKRGSTGASRRSPVSSSSSYTTFGSEEDDNDETVAEVPAGRSRAAPQMVASSPAVRRLRTVGSERGGFAKSSPVKTRARSRHSIANRRARPAARMSRTAATAASPRKPALRPRRPKQVVFSQRVKRMEIDGSGEEVSDEDEAGEPDEGAADASGEASSAVGSEEEDTSESEQQGAEQAQSASDSDEAVEEDAPGDDTFEVSDEDEAMSVDGRSPPPPRRRAGSGRATIPVVTPPVLARGEATRSRIAMPPPRVPSRMHRSSARLASPESDDAQDGADEAADDDEALDDDDEEDDEDIDDAQHASPSKMRKLRNGKQLRIHTPSGSSSARAVRPQPAEASDSGGEEESDSQAESEAEEDEAEEDDPMADPKQATLARLRLARLAELCEERDIDTKGKKAFLIDRLLQHHRARTAAAAPSSQASRSSVDSATTERPASSTAGKKGKGKVRPVVANAPGRKRSAAHVPLLLRSHSRQTLASKPDSPALDPCNPEAQPAEAVDELNGLDLESLNLLDKEIPPHRLEKLEKIGSGGFKDVYVGKYFHQKSRAQKVAIADIRDDLTEMDIKELSLLRDLRHENIVRFIGVSIPDAPRHVPCMIVSELCTNGDLFDYIRNVPAPSNDDIFRIMLETARGIEYLHGREPAIIHRDIKSTNILITRDRHAKINDFGLARVKNTRRSMMRSLVGTVNWQAAELWRPKPHYNEKVDVWSVAMTFWETLQWHEKVKKYPFEGMNEHQIYLEVGGDKRVRPKTTNVRKLFGDGIVELLERMWEAQPRLRPTMSDVCAELERLIAEARAAARAARRA